MHTILNKIWYSAKKVLSINNTQHNRKKVKLSANKNCYAKFYIIAIIQSVVILNAIVMIVSAPYLYNKHSSSLLCSYFQSLGKITFDNFFERRQSLE